MTRSEILSRYRRLRQISKQQHEAVLDIIAADVLLDWARRLELTVGKTVVLENDNELTLPEAWPSTSPGRAGHTRSSATPGSHGWRPVPTRPSCSRPCARHVSRSGASNGGTRPRA